VLAGHHEQAREDLARSHDRWEGYLARELDRMRERGELLDRADGQGLALRSIMEM